MSEPLPPATTDPVMAARRELHELAVLSSALLRLATKVQSRCDDLRRTLGDIDPLDDGEIDRYAPRGADGRPVPVGSAERGRADDVADDEDPAALLAMSLAGEGLSRAQIAEYLQQSFGMAETDELLDRVLRDRG